MVSTRRSGLEGTWLEATLYRVPGDDEKAQGIPHLVALHTLAGVPMMNEFEKLQELTLKSIISLTERMQMQDEEISILREEIDSLETSLRLEKQQKIKAEESLKRERLKYKILCQEAFISGAQIAKGKP